MLSTRLPTVRTVYLALSLSKVMTPFRGLRDWHGDVTTCYVLSVIPSSVDEAAALAQLRAWVRSGVARDARAAAGLSLGEAAAAAGPPPVASSTIYRWEAHQRIPTGKAALRYHRLIVRLLDTGGRHTNG